MVKDYSEDLRWILYHQHILGPVRKQRAHDYLCRWIVFTRGILDWLYQDCNRAPLPSIDTERYTMTIGQEWPPQTDVYLPGGKRDTTGLLIHTVCSPQQNIYVQRADHCVPDNATLVEESVIGVPPDTTNITTWRYFTQTPLVTSVTMVTVLDNCIPLRSSMQGSAPEGNTVTTTVLYTSYRAGINDLSVFDIPTNCDNFPVG
ncbi:hypothetical protein ScPMuIL_005024 [Solemya velum]